MSSPIHNSLQYRDTIFYHISGQAEGQPQWGHSRLVDGSFDTQQMPQCWSFCCSSACSRSPFQRRVPAGSRAVGHPSHGRSLPQSCHHLSAHVQLCSMPVIIMHVNIDLIAYGLGKGSPHLLTYSKKQLGLNILVHIMQSSDIRCSITDHQVCLLSLEMTDDFPCSRLLYK